MKNTDNEITAKTTLRTEAMRFAGGMTREQADQMLDETLAGWPLFGGSFETLEKVTRVVSPNVMKPGAVVFFLHASVLAMESRNGCELMLAGGLRAASRCGVTNALVDLLRKHVVDAPSDDETRH